MEASGRCSHAHSQPGASLCDPPANARQGAAGRTLHRRKSNWVDTPPRSGLVGKSGWVGGCRWGGGLV